MAANVRMLYFIPAAVSVLLSSAAPAVAQNSLQLFGSTHDRLSVSTTTTSNPATFNSSTVNVTCGSTAPITAKLSSTADGTGNVLVDNFIKVSVSNGGAFTTPQNVCSGGTSESGASGTQNNCFNSGYQSDGATTTLVGQDLNPFVPKDGVPAPDISSLFSPTIQQVKIDLVDTGVVLTSANLYLVTSCTIGGVTGPATVTGNPISGSNPTGDQLKQDFDFNTNPNQAVGFTYDISTSQSNGGLSIADSTIPNTQDMPLDPTLWQPVYAKGTSFATSSCIIHRGELLNGVSSCKLYTLTCQVGTGAASAGALCPVSQLRDEVFADQFTGPKFTLPDIAGPNGKTYHEGVGLLMAAEGWTGGSCIFDTASGLQANDCPQNLLTFFSSPGSTTAPAATSSLLGTQALVTSAMFLDFGDDSMSIDGTGTHPNSTFVSVFGVPEDLTTVKVVGAHFGGWVNHHTVKVEMESEPPVLPATVPNYQNFVASPIQSLTYGLAPATTVLSTKFAIPGDTVLIDPNGCPTAGSPTPTPATEFAPPSQYLTGVADGQYLLHYFAQDCAGTQELKFNPVGNGGWQTSFFTVPVNVDTVPPRVTSLVLSPAPSTINGVPNAYREGQKVTAYYRCKDDASGVVECGHTNYKTAGILDTGVLSKVIYIGEDDDDLHTFSVEVEDAAGNDGNTVSVTYNVVDN